MESQEIDPQRYIFQSLKEQWQYNKERKMIPANVSRQLNILRKKPTRPRYRPYPFTLKICF